MPKRKPPPERRVWARVINHAWRATLVDGEVLTPIRDITAAEAADVSASLPTVVAR